MQEKQEMNIKKLSSVKIIVIVLLIVSVIIFGSLSWFTMSREVEGSGTQMTASDLPFELKTEGYYGYYDDYLPEEYTKIKSSLAVAGLPTTGTRGTLTTKNGASIQWLIESDHNTKNYVTSSSKDSDKGIRPGTSGEMKFWVVSKGTGKINIKFKLNTILYKTKYQLDSNNNIVLDDNNVPVELSPELIESTDSDYAEIRNYVRSHIVLFKKRTPVMKNNEVDYYTYSDLIPLDTEFQLVYDGNSKKYTDELSFTLNEDTYLDEPFSIYWIWPETLAEAVLPENKQNFGIVVRLDK